MKLLFKDSYIGRLRSLIGKQTLIVSGFRIIIEDKEGRILFIKRSDDGMWGLPAGTPELGESLEDCIRREVNEETSLKVESFDCFGCATNPKQETHTYPNGDKVQSFTFLICAKEWSGQPGSNDDETTEVKFLHESQLPAKEITLQHEIASIALLKKYKKSGNFQWS